MKMYFVSLVLVVQLLLLGSFTDAFQGKYEAYNAQQPAAVTVKQMDNSAENDIAAVASVGRGSTTAAIKNFFGTQNRAPAHDTPATPCKCSE